MRNPLHVVVMPEPGVEEMADCNWIDWMVVGHESPSALEAPVLDALVKEFFATGIDRDDPVTDAFLQFMDSKGYTTFDKTRLRWAADD